MIGFVAALAALLYCFVWLRPPELGGVVLPLQRVLGWTALTLLLVRLLIKGPLLARAAARSYLWWVAAFGAFLLLMFVRQLAYGETFFPLYFVMDLSKYAAAFAVAYLCYYALAAGLVPENRMVRFMVYSGVAATVLVYVFLALYFAGFRTENQLIAPSFGGALGVWPTDAFLPRLAGPTAEPQQLSVALLTPLLLMLSPRHLRRFWPAGLLDCRCTAAVSVEVRPDIATGSGAVPHAGVPPGQGSVGTGGSGHNSDRGSPSAPAAHPAGYTAVRTLGWGLCRAAGESPPSRGHHPGTPVCRDRSGPLRGIPRPGGLWRPDVLPGIHAEHGFPQGVRRDWGAGLRPAASVAGVPGAALRSELSNGAGRDAANLPRAAPRRTHHHAQHEHRIRAAPRLLLDQCRHAAVLCGLVGSRATRMLHDNRASWSAAPAGEA